MPNNTNVGPVKERLASLLGGSVDSWGPVVGRHFGRRSNLVHGTDERVVGAEHIDELRMIVEVLLAAELRADARPHAAALRAAAGLSARRDG